MANNNNPHGLRPIMRTLEGGFPTVRPYNKAVGTLTGIFINDAVVMIADGSVSAATGDITPGTTAYSGVSLSFGITTKATKHLVIVSPSAVYEAQDDDSGAGILAADIGLNANIALGAGSATTLLSAHTIHDTGKNTTNSLDLHLLQLLAVPDNDPAGGPFARVEVIFNKHRMAGVTAGV